MELLSEQSAEYAEAVRKDTITFARRRRALGFDNPAHHFVPSLKVGDRFCFNTNSDCLGNRQVFEVACDHYGKIMECHSLCFKEPACGDHLPAQYFVPGGTAKHPFEMVDSGEPATKVSNGFWLDYAEAQKIPPTEMEQKIADSLDVIYPQQPDKTQEEETQDGSADDGEDELADQGECSL
jgi:hypothetical protein